MGGICVSRSVRDHVRGRLDLAFEPIGELTLKNIARPVEAFVLRPAPMPVALDPDIAKAPRLSLAERPMTELDVQDW